LSGLFTVLIAEKEHIDAIRQDNKLFFEPFLNSKELAFCYWNPAGQNLQDSVPGLLDVVGRTRNWRAIILNPFVAEQAKMQNPYDTVDYSGLANLAVPARQPAEGESWESWEASWDAYDESLARRRQAKYQHHHNGGRKKNNGRGQRKTAGGSKANDAFADKRGAYNAGNAYEQASCRLGL
jgi:hypothetical protein